MADSPIVVLISANAEWQPVIEFYGHPPVKETPFGGCFTIRDEGRKIIFVKSGWGKISAAASTQYSIMKFHPSLLINLGTCGGIAGKTRQGDILLVDETLVYDIIERMGDSNEAVQFYTARLDLSFLREPFPLPVIRGRLLSADQDIDPLLVPMLISRHQAIASDWESGAIAWTAQRNRTRCLILRGVTDVVSPQGGEIYNGIESFQQRADEEMHRLLNSLPGWVRCIDMQKLD